MAKLSRYLAQRLLALCAAFCMSIAFVPAVHADFFEHSPPTFRQNGEMELSLAAEGLARARVFLFDVSGLQAVPLERNGDRFQQTVSLHSNDSLRYQLQVETTTGVRKLSPVYVIAAPLSRELQSELEQLRLRTREYETRVRRLRNAIASVEKTSVKRMAERVPRELAQAKEHSARSRQEQERYRRRSERRLRFLDEELGRSEKGRRVESARRALDFKSEVWKK